MSAPLIVIPCRAGSRGIIRKNFQTLGEVPLWRWTLTTAQYTGWPFLFTTDEEGAGLLKREALPLVVRRPDIPDVMSQIVAEAVLEAPGDPIVVLQPTSPFRQLQDVLRAVKTLRACPQYTSVVSVAKVPLHLSPDYVGRIHGGTWQPWSEVRPTRRQDVRAAYYRTGDVYTCWRKTLKTGSLYGARCHPLVVPHQSVVNIDTQKDLDEARRRLAISRENPLV